ncbi:MAG TPA: hypothetical protein VL443_11175 [Cyclobacteriaceae bacterium]|nr:hypothetical protein [Cyclobacteriaceae bacterium]
MIKILSTLAILCVSFFTQAQKIISEIPIESIGNLGRDLEIQALEINDSIFIANNLRKKEPAKALWILPNGTVRDLSSPVLKNKVFVCINSIGDSTYFYYLEDHTNYVLLKALVQNKQSGEIIISDKSVIFSGDFLNLFKVSGNNLYLISLKKEKNEIHVIEINKLNKLKEQVFVPTLNLLINESPFVFVREGEQLSPHAAESPNKIFQQGHVLYIDIDKDSKKGGTPAKTSFFKLNLLTGQSELNDIIDLEKIQFRTYIQGNYIFKISKSRAVGCIINIYNLDNYRVVKTVTIDEKSKIASNRAIKKDFLKTHDKESVWDAISNTSSAFITATELDSSRIILKLGSHHTITHSPGSYIPIISAIPVLAIIGATVRLATLSISEVESVDQYLYLKWNGKDAVVFPDTIESANQKIDAFDIDSFKREISYAYKGYVQSHNKIFGIYQPVAYHSISIMLFENQ